MKKVLILTLLFILLFTVTAHAYTATSCSLYWTTSAYSAGVNASSYGYGKISVPMASAVSVAMRLQKHDPEDGFVTRRTANCSRGATSTTSYTGEGQYRVKFSASTSIGSQATGEVRGY